jgi:integrase/recombinase XerD
VSTPRALVVSPGPAPLVLVRAGALDRNPAAVYLAGLPSPQSQRTMRQALSEIAELVTGEPNPLLVKWHALRFQHTAALRAALARKHRAATANKVLSALRGVLKAAHSLDLMSSSDYRRALAFKGVSGSTLPRGRALAAGEIAALLEACAQDESAAGARDGALIALLRAGGLRRAEVCALEVADYDALACTLRVQGKRNKQREMPLAQGAADALADWLEVRGRKPGPLFNPVSQIGDVERGHSLTPQVIYNVLAKRAREAGVKDLSPHDFRRTFVSDLLDAGADISTVQRLAGHSNVTTTQRYDRRGEAAKRKAVDLLHVPYRKRRPPGAP